MVNPQAFKAVGLKLFAFGPSVFEDREDMDPTQASIEVWEERLRLFVEERWVVLHGPHACPLCKKHRGRTSCYACPIKKHTGKDSCEGTPYTAVAEVYHRLFRHVSRCFVYSEFKWDPTILDEVESALRAEVEFLKSLKEAQ
jgi:hypothetical protein